MTKLIIFTIVASLPAYSLLTSFGAFLQSVLFGKKTKKAHRAIEELGQPDTPPIRGPAVAGLTLIGLFFGVFVFWAGSAPLQSAAVAPGTVNLDTYRKTVQHFEGGIIKTILVREGQFVAKDEVLIQLDETQARAQIHLLQAQLVSRQSQLELISEELEDIESLFKRGLTTQSRLLALKRRKVELRGERTEKVAQLEAAHDVIERSKIRAPIGGTVVNLQFHTSGGVIKPGDPLLSIVPKDEPLVIEAQVDPNDIDVVHNDLPAQVRLTPLNARMVPPLKGRVVWISADRMSDQQSGASYYLARVKITSAPHELPQDVALYPGMPAEVIITTGQHTFLDYLTAPVTRSFRRAFRED